MTKKILITGKNSYVGNQLADWLNKEPEKYTVVKESVRDGKWKEIDFSVFDVVVHVAGIAHNSSNPKLKTLYYQVNQDLTVEIAKKAKDEGVKQFIYMSSIIVYGNKSNGKTAITPQTKPNPDNFYGDSKLQAEKKIQKFNDGKFSVVILRPPMIYGKGSKGNYPLLAKLAKATPVFPDYPNKRSMLHIDNLCELIRLVIINKEIGTFHPQNAELVQTSEMVNVIAEYSNHKIWATSVGNSFIRKLLKINLIKKLFGNLYYLPSMSNYDKGNYQIRSLKESIRLTEE